MPELQGKSIEIPGYLNSTMIGNRNHPKVEKYFAMRQLESNLKFDEDETLEACHVFSIQRLYWLFFINMNRECLYDFAQ